MTENTRGAVFMALAMTAFTCNDALIKALAAELPVFQAVFLRGLGATALLTVLAWRRGAFRVPVARRDRRLMLLRAGAEVGAMVPFFIALTAMPLANVSAILQVLPLSVTLAGAVFLGERVGWRRWSAIAVGFCGVLLVVRPGTDGFNVYALAAFAAVGAVTLRDILTRRLAASVPPLLIAAVMSAVVTLAGLVITLGQGWQAVTGPTWLGLCAASGVIVLAYYFIVLATRHGDIAVVAPFRYTSLVVALGLGWAVFGDWPDRLTLAGAAIVVATGVFTLVRSARLNRSRPPVVLR